MRSDLRPCWSQQQGISFSSRLIITNQETCPYPTIARSDLEVLYPIWMRNDLHAAKDCYKKSVPLDGSPYSFHFPLQTFFWMGWSTKILRCLLFTQHNEMICSLEKEIISERNHRIGSLYWATTMLLHIIIEFTISTPLSIIRVLCKYWSIVFDWLMNCFGIC